MKHTELLRRPRNGSTTKPQPIKNKPPTPIHGCGGLFFCGLIPPASTTAAKTILSLRAHAIAAKNGVKTSWVRVERKFADIRAALGALDIHRGHINHLARDKSTILIHHSVFFVFLAFKTTFSVTLLSMYRSWFITFDCSMKRFRLNISYHIYHFVSTRCAGP